MSDDHYEANFALDADIEGVRMDLRDDTVTDLDGRPALPDLPDRAPATDAHRRGVGRWRDASARETWRI
jgi:hypothetical protein